MNRRTARFFALSLPCLLLPLLLPVGCGRSVEGKASLVVRLHRSEDGAVQAKVHATLVRMKEGMPTAFHTLEPLGEAGTDVVVLVAGELPPGSYRIRAQWNDYLWSDGEHPGGRPLPAAERVLDLGPGEHCIDIDLCHGFGTFVTVKGLPKRLGEFVRVEAPSAVRGDPDYACRLSLLPEWTDGEGWYLPGVPDTGGTIRLAGILPGWEPALDGKAAEPPERLSFAFPDTSFHALELEVLYPSGEPVAGFLSAQHVDWDFPFLDPLGRIDLLNIGRGRRRIEALPAGAYRIYFTWYDRDGGEGCEELLTLTLTSSVSRRVTFEPSTVYIDTDGLAPGTYQARIRLKGEERIRSQKTFTLPDATRPFSLVFAEGKVEVKVRKRD